MESDADGEIKRAVYLLEIRSSCTPKIEITVDHAVGALANFRCLRLTYLRESYCRLLYEQEISILLAKEFYRQQS
jgi:hypothetical protein